MREHYIDLVFSRYLSGTGFWKKYGADWYRFEDMSAVSDAIIADAFLIFGLNVNCRLYQPFFDIFMEKITKSSVLAWDGDKYTGEHFKFRQMSPNPTEKFVAENPAQKRATRLGPNALISALIAIDDELSAESLENSESQSPTSGIHENEAKKNETEESRNIPAADRSVRIDHNAPVYQEIESALDMAIIKAEKIRPNTLSGDEHSSIIVGLQSASTLWKAYVLTESQIKVGILMAIERAEEVLKVSFSLVKGQLLMEALKAFLKSAKDGDLS